MGNFHEPYFTINGVKSCIHCLYCHRTQTPPEKTVPNGGQYHDYVEILYATDADMYAWLNGERHRFKTGDMIVINSNEVHSFTYLKESHYICVKFSPQILCSDEQTFFEFKYMVPFLKQNPNQKIFCENNFKNINLRDIFEEIMKEWKMVKSVMSLLSVRIFCGFLRRFSDIGTPITK